MKEEWANSLTHGIGLVLSVIGLPILLGGAIQESDMGITTGVVVFSFSLVALYAASTLYHSARTPDLKRVLRIVDHIAIYFLIAGTYTPFVLAFFSPGPAVTLLALVWGIALVGAVYKLFFIGRWSWLSTALYLLMGWSVVLAAGELLTNVPTTCLLWLAAGGLSYSGGVIFFAWESLRYNHAIWHLFVLAGSLCHWIAIAGWVV